MTVKDVLEKITQLCKRYHVQEAILFGSRAKGTATDRSDIDIAVSGVGDYDSFLEEIQEIPTLYTVYLVDMDTCGNVLLLEDIRQYGRKIYEEI